MTEKRALRDDDVVHMTLASPTGAASPVDVPITLGEIAAYMAAKMAPAAPAVEPVAETAPVAPAA